MLNAIKTHVTKKGDNMAFLQLEDLSGQIEAIVFPRIYQEIQPQLILNNLVIIDGKIDKQDDKLQIIIEAMKSAESLLDQIKPGNLSHQNFEADDSGESMLRLHLPLHQIEEMDKLKRILEESSGNVDHKVIPVEALVMGQSLQKRVQFGRQFWIENPETALTRLHSAGFKVKMVVADCEIK
jgi:DNA polymerase-3 subunit alpha